MMLGLSRQILSEFGDDDYDTHRARKLVFDRAFLLWLQERDASAPYFVAWNANGELMESFGPANFGPAK